MKRLMSLMMLAAAAAVAGAQTLNVNVGQVTYAFPASRTGNVGVTTSEISIGQNVFPLSSVTSIKVDASAVADNSVKVIYDGSTARVVIAGNVAPLVKATVSGAHVTLLQDQTVAEEITYTLSGTSDNGSLYMDGSYKATFVMDNLNLHNPDSAAINIQDGKRIAVILNDGTANSLSDGIRVADDGSDAHNACMYVDGHTEFGGAGTLTITGNVKHAFTSDEYCEVKATAGTLTVASALGDGFHIGQYYHQKGGTVVINASGDGIDVGAKKDTTKEFNGQMMLDGGVTTVSVTGATSDAMKCDAAFTMTGGTFRLLSKGAGGRALNTNGSITISGGYLQGVTCGAVFDPNLATERKPHAMKSDGDITINGGEVYMAASLSSGTSYKTDNFFLTNGGTIMGIGAKTPTPAAASLQKYRVSTPMVVAGGSSVSFSGLSFTLPKEYTSGSAYVIVSKPGL